MTLSTEQKAALGEKLLATRQMLKQQLLQLQEQDDAITMALSRNQGFYEQFVGPMPPEEV
jgi:hypothetical protein